MYHDGLLIVNGLETFLVIACDKSLHQQVHENR